MYDREKENVYVYECVCVCLDVDMNFHPYISSNQQDRKFTVGTILVYLITCSYNDLDHVIKQRSREPVHPEVAINSYCS